MAQDMEPMDVDCIDSEFDNKENTYHNNMLPCTEKGYEELDVSELNMKLRYSITPAASPMSKSYTAYRDQEADELSSIENNLTRSLNSTITKHDSIIKSLKTLPLQSLLADQLDSRNSSVLRPLDTTITDPNNITVTISDANEIDENLSLPSTSSSVVHTPEATTPVNDGGSPIMRGLKSVLNMFRPSQSPIPPGDLDSGKPEASLSLDSSASVKPVALASTPIAAHRKKEGSSSKRSSPLKDSIVFNDDLEKELQWKDETTIIFSQEKIPIHKLFFQNAKPTEDILKNTQLTFEEQISKSTDIQPAINNMNTTVEHMDVSYNNMTIHDKTLSKTQVEDQIEVVIAAESDSEFVDCETTLNNESHIQDNENSIKDPPLKAEAPTVDITSTSTEKSENIQNEEVNHVEIKITQNIPGNSEHIQNIVVTKPETEIKEDTDSTISILQELDSLLEGNDSKKDTSSNENNLSTTVDTPTEIITESVTKENQDNQDTTNEIAKTTEVTTDIVNLGNYYENLISTLPLDIPTTNLTEDILKIDDHSSESKLDCAQITIEPQDIITTATYVTEDCNQPELVAPCTDNHCIPVNDLNDNKVAIEQEETPADVPLPDEDAIDTEIIANTVNLDTTDIIQTPPYVSQNAQTEVKLIVAEHLEKAVTVTSQDVIQNFSESVTLLNNKQVNQETDMHEEVLNTTHVISNTVKVTESVNKIEEAQCIPNDSDINEIKIEENILPDLIHQTMSINNASNLLDDRDGHNLESVKFSIDINSVQDALIQEPHNMSITELPIKEISVADMTDIQSEIKTIINYAENIANTTSNEADSTITLDDQTFNNQNNITVEDKITTKDNDINSTVTNGKGTNKDLVSLTVLLEESKDETKEILSADIKSDLVLENANLTTILDKDICPNENTHNMTVAMESDTSTEHAITRNDHIPIQEDAVNSTVIVDHKDIDKNANLTTILDKDICSNENTDNMIVAMESDTSTEHAITCNDHIPIQEDAVNSTVIVDHKDIDNRSVKSDEINNLGECEAQAELEILPNIDSQSTAQNLDDILEAPTDIEIIVSENNSPYVSVMAGIDTVPKSEDNIETHEFSRPDVPSSPPIVSKGYNFNFDDIEDPFATKTKIRPLSPTNTPNENITEDLLKTIELPRKAPINRRKSQPPERKGAVNNKKKLNTTINVNMKEFPAEFEKETIRTEVKVESAETTAAFISNEVLEEGKTNLEQASANNKSINLEDIKIEGKALSDSSTNIAEVKTTSSSEQSYFSAAGSSTESYISKNVFNIPEIDDSNFNPFATKSKMRESPPLVMEENPFATKSKLSSSPDSSMVINEIKDVGLRIDVELTEKDAMDSSAVSSSKSDEKNVTHDVNTEDEDTEEGPFLEAEEVLVKTSVLSNDQMEINSLPAQSESNLESGEVFIDAEAFEFFLNQNQSSMVADSGKESLFLKFDPLFAKRISSDGVVAALKNVQRRQSTPTKTRPTLKNDVSPIAGPSNLNNTFETDINASQESNDEANITIAKPTMIVTPAINPVVTPRNKSITPNRSNRRSITFTSPAMAVIDRLISMSANNSLVDTTMTQTSRDQHEADAALSQLRELLAEKEINVYNLRAESMLLKERLATMESQVKTLESEGQNRLKKINELNSRLLEKSEINKRMAEVVEEYERTIASLIAETEQDKKRHAEERIQLIKERDEQTAHLASMEASFSDLHSKYEKSKQVILSCKANEETYKKSINDFEESLKKMQNNYEMLKQHATSKLNHANQELEKMNKAHEAEVLKLNALLKRKELHITSLEESLVLKTKANDELTSICDELINKVG